MGRDNASLIRSCEQARKSGKKSELKRLTALIELSQERCPHRPRISAAPARKRTHPQANTQKREQLLPLLEKSLGTATLSAFGYGADADQELLADLAKKGKGNYAFVKNPDDALSAFAKELGGLLSTYAQNIEIKVTPHNGHRISEVLSDVDVEQNGNDVTIKLPDILAEEERHIVLGMKLSEQSQALPRAMNIADVKFTYEQLAADGVRNKKTEELKAKIVFVKSGDEQTKPTEEVDKVVGIAQLVKRQSEAERHAERGDFAGAAAVMSCMASDLESRGLGAHAVVAKRARLAMQDAGSFQANKGYLRSSKSAGSRAYGTSGMDEGAAADYAAMGVSISNSAQGAVVESFTGKSGVPSPNAGIHVGVNVKGDGGVNVHVAPSQAVESDPKAPKKEDKSKKPQGLTKKRSTSRW